MLDGNKKESFQLLGPCDPDEIFDTIWDQSNNYVLLPAETPDMPHDPEIDRIFDQE